jgi:hypothetical protein
VGERGLGRLAGSAAWLERRRSRILLALTTYLLVCFAWVFFRAADFASALEICGAMLGGGADGPSVLLRGSTRLVLALTVATLGVHWWMRERTLEELATGLPSWAKAASIGLMWTCLALAPGDERAFIYFQF